MVTECLLTTSLVTPSRLFTSDSDHSLPRLSRRHRIPFVSEKNAAIVMFWVEEAGHEQGLEQNPRHCPDITRHKWMLRSYTPLYPPHTGRFKASSGHRAGCQRKWQKRCSSYCGCFHRGQLQSATQAHRWFEEGQEGPCWSPELVWY